MYTIIWILALGMPPLVYWHHKRRHLALKPSWRSAPDWFDYGMMMGCMALLVGLPAIICTATAQDLNIGARNASYVIEQRRGQRDELSALIRDELSADKYADLLGALPDDIPNLRVWLGSDAGEVLTARADRIIALNAEVAAMELKVTEDRRDACNMVQNPLIPTLPFRIYMPDCELKGGE